MGTNTSDLEKRKYIRHASDIPIEVKKEDKEVLNTDSLNNISLGGLSFKSSTPAEPGSTVHIKLSLPRIDFETQGQVVWCRGTEGNYGVGVNFLKVNDAFRMRMIEQICYIELYRKKVFDETGRQLTTREAAVEWISKYADQFPFFDE